MLKSLVALPLLVGFALADSSVMAPEYWQIWNAEEQARIDADIEKNRKADAVVPLDLPAGTEVEVEQISSDFRFGAHIFNFNQLGKKEWNDAYKASYGEGGLFNQATVAFYWNAYEPEPGRLRAQAAWDDTEAYWNALSVEASQRERFWRRPAPGPVIDYLKRQNVAVHGHILVWGLAKPFWIYDWYCPENEKRAFDKLGIPRHTSDQSYTKRWRAAWREAFERVNEEEIERMAPVFAANMRRVFKKRIADIARDFGEFADSWDVVNESSEDWAHYGASRTGRGVWRSTYGLMPGDYPLHALMDAKESFPEPTRLVINDWNLGGDFQAQVADLTKEGARIDVVGCQMHIFDTNECVKLARGEVRGSWKGVWVGSPATIRARLDTMAETGRPIHVSEVTIAAPGDDAKSREIQAILTRNIYRAWFSHPATMGITWWNTVDGGGVAGEPLVSGLFTRDLQKKPVYHALDRLINHEWRTRKRVEVEGQRAVKFRGFLGRYRLGWTCPRCGERHVKTVHLGKGGVDTEGPDVCEYVCRVPVRSFAVDGTKVELDAKETALDLKKFYPSAVVKGQDGTRTAKIVFSVAAPEAGTVGLWYQNDWWGRLFVNGRDCGETQGPWGAYRCRRIELEKGANEIRFESRAGSGGEWRAAFACSFSFASPTEFLTLPNVASMWTVWNGRSVDWTKVGNRNYPLPFVEWVELMAATGGNPERDCLKDPKDRTVLDDYDFGPLVTACRGILDMGAKPYLKLGGVPSKFTEDANGGSFKTNIRPPTDPLVHYRYMRACAAALKDAFGREAVRSWRFSVLTEADNFSWFKSVDGDRAHTREAFFSLYDYTVRAFEEELGEGLVIGTHLLDPNDVKTPPFTAVDFARHCLAGTNAATGGRGAPLRLLTFSNYIEPGRNGAKGPNKFGAIAKALAEVRALGYTNLVTGIDEGRVIWATKGALKRDISTRAVGQSYEAAYDVRLAKTAYDMGFDYVATWGWFSGPESWEGLPSHHYFTQREIAAFAGMRRLPDAVVEADPSLDIVAAVSPDGQTVRVMAGFLTNALNATNRFDGFVRLRLPMSFAGRRVTMSTLTLDDRNNWFFDWQADRRRLDIKDADFDWSPDDFAVMGGRGLQKPEYRRIFAEELQPRYAQKARSVCPVVSATKVPRDGIVTLPVVLQGNGAAFLSFESQEN